MSDIIAAISTALAPSGVGIIRLSGAGCAHVAQQILTPVYGKPLPDAAPRKLCLYDLHDRQGRIIDRILAVYTPGPHSYTVRATPLTNARGSPDQSQRIPDSPAATFSRRITPPPAGGRGLSPSSAPSPPQPPRSSGRTSRTHTV